MSKPVIVFAASSIFAASLSLFSAAASAEPERCVHNYFAPQPCISSISAWRNFADSQGLDRDRASARIFQAYAERDFSRGDTLLAQAKGVSVAAVRGTGLQVAAAVGNRPVY